jgi:hypothetical protein
MSAEAWFDIAALAIALVAVLGAGMFYEYAVEFWDRRAAARRERGRASFDRHAEDAIRVVREWPKP